MKCLLTLAALVGVASAVQPKFWGFFTKEEKEWCDPVLGCLYVTDDWYSELRPINVLPDSRESINTRFMLHTREDRADDHDVFVVAGNATTIDVSTFDPSRPTKFITHGFIDTGNTYWLPELANVFLDYMDCNVFRVDWGGGSLPMYSQAAANTRVVGLEIAYMVNWLIETYGVEAGDVHLMGHSLGAHTCGYAGEQITGLGRISGFDPAGPYYTGTPTFVRLDPTDAVFVDNIHTDADSILLLGYGTGQPMGHIDFYPNSGHDQPGCDPVSIAIDAVTPDDVGDIRDIAACSHCRSIFLYEASIQDDTCDFLGHTCFDYDSFELGECRSCSDDNTACAYMGIRADEYVAKESINKMFYLDTDDDEEPFCMEHYVVTLLTAHPDDAEDWVVGHLSATFYGDTGAVLEDIKISDEHRRIDHGLESSFLIESHVILGTILRAEFTWDYDDQLLRPGTYCWSLLCNRNLYVESFEVSPINYYPETERLAHTQVLCSTDGSVTEIKDGKSVSVAPTGNCSPVP